MSPRNLIWALEQRRWRLDEQRLACFLLDLLWAAPARIPAHERSGR